MYDFENSSDSSTSTLKDSNALFVTSREDSDQDSDSTIIMVEENSDSSVKCTPSDSKFASMGKSGNTKCTNNMINYPTTSKTTCIDDKFMRLDKPTTSNYCKDNNSYFSKDKIDSELESILLKYSSPLLNTTITNSNCRLEGIARPTSTNNELIELSSDEDLPPIQLKTANKPTSTEIKSKVGMVANNGGLSNKHIGTFNEEDEDLAQFQIGNNNRPGSIIFERDVVDVDNGQLSNEYLQMFDEDLPSFNTKNHKQTSFTSMTATERDNEDIFNKYKTVFNDNGVMNTVENSINSFQKEDMPDLYRSPKRKRKLSSEEKNKKTSKAALQAKKREEAETAKQLKKVLLAANKNMQPEECMKFLTVLLDSEIANEKYGGEVLNALQAADITYRLQSQLIPCTITWNRKEETHLMNENEHLTATSVSVETSEVLLILMWKQVVELVHSQSLVTHIKSLQSILANKKLSLAIYGMEDYFKYQKSQKQKELQSEVTRTSQKTNNKYHKIYKDVAKISKNQLEFALTELQLFCCCCHRMVETAHDLGAIIVQYTKAIAQAPYKLEKQRKQQEEEWYISGDNKDCVRVDKNGNGLQRLWRQQLTTFPLARLEHAESIAAKYSTPTNLMKDYSRCTQTEGEKLLQDIPIRRAAGPLTTVKKIGPELSKKIFKFFTSTDGNTVL